MDSFNEILEEIFNIRRNCDFVFNDYFVKYSISESEKFSLYRKLMAALGDYVALEQGYERNGFVEIVGKYKNTTVGLPYNLPHKKLK